MLDSTPATELRTAAARLRKYDTDVLRPGDGLALADWLEDTARYAVLYADITVAWTGAAPVETDYDSLTRHALKAARQVLCRTAAWEPASTAPLAAGLPLVKGHCPACGGASLFLGVGGYVTCSRIDCPVRDAASTVLEQPASAPAATEGPTR